MGNGRRYTKEQITFVLGLLVQSKSRAAIVEEFHKKFNPDGKLDLSFGPKQVKYIKQGYGKHPDYGHPFLTQQDTERYSAQTSQGNPSSSKKEDEEDADDEYDESMESYGEAFRAGTNEALIPPRSAGGFNTPLSFASAAAEHTSLGSNTAPQHSTGEKASWLLTRPVNLNFSATTEASQTCNDAGTGCQADHCQGSQVSPSDAVRNRRLARTDLGGNIPAPSGSHVRVALPAGTWLERHNRCPIASPHRHQPDGSVTFRTMDDFLRTHLELRDMPVQALDRAVRDTIGDIAQQVAALHGKKSTVRQPGAFARTRESARPWVNEFIAFSSAYPPIPGTSDRATPADDGTLPYTNRFVAVNTRPADNLSLNPGMPDQPSS